MFTKFLQRTVAKVNAGVREIKKSSFRSPRWDEVRDQHLESNNECAACGTRLKLQVHHIRPFHLYPELELEPKNLITLCMDEWDCHLKIGHGGSFHSYNPHVEEDVYRFRHAVGERYAIINEAKLGREPI